MLLRSILEFLTAIPKRIYPGIQEEESYPDVVVFDESVYAEVLKALGKFDDIRNKQIKCRICDGLITQESLRAILPNNGTYDFVCDDPLCYHNYFINKGA